MAKVLDVGGPQLPGFYDPSGGQQQDQATNGGQADGQASAIEAANARLATQGLPNYDPTLAPSLDPATAGHSPVYNALSGVFTKPPAEAALSSIAPNPWTDLKHFFWDGSDSPEAHAYDTKRNAYNALTTPQVQQYAGSHPDVLAQMQADPVGTAVKIGPIMEAMVAQQQGKVAPATLAHPNGMVKTDENPALTAHIADAHGLTPGQAHALHNTHAYSWPEFQAATKGITNGQLGRMWEMQHYLNPTQQATSALLSHMEGLTRTGTPEQRGAAQQQYLNVLRTMVTGIPSAN